MSQVILQKQFAAHTDQLKQLRDWARDAAKQAGLDNERVEQVVIGVNEACMNIIEHAYKKKEGDVIFEVRQEPEQLIFQLTDFAETVDCSCIKSRELDDIRPGGLGVHFIKQAMDQVIYLPGQDGVGNIIKMVIKTDKKREPL